MIHTVVLLMVAACFGLAAFLLGMIVQERVSRCSAGNRPINVPVPLASIDFDDAQCRADAQTRGGL